MIPSDFSDYFKNCAEVEQQSIIDELLKMSASQGLWLITQTQKQFTAHIARANLFAVMES
jgi:hypothetical protein